ncbi:MAG: hypothetical protein H6732_14345 [Alphaproteobacteria bacterium]|nr:hypothetical protein [Alphaproteobacteria bacterium]
MRHGLLGAAMVLLGGCATQFEVCQIPTCTEAGGDPCKQIEFGTKSLDTLLDDIRDAGACGAYIVRCERAPIWGSSSSASYFVHYPTGDGQAWSSEYYTTETTTSDAHVQRLKVDRASQPSSDCPTGAVEDGDVGWCAVRVVWEVPGACDGGSGPVDETDTDTDTDT